MNQQEEHTPSLDLPLEDTAVKQGHMTHARNEVRQALDLWTRRADGRARKPPLYPAAIFDRIKDAESSLSIAAADLDWAGDESAEANAERRAKEGRDLLKAVLPDVPEPAAGHLRVAVAFVREA